MNETINVALVGFGFAGRSFHAPLVAAVEGLRLHTIVSSQGALARGAHPDARVVGDYDEALTDPHIDLVVLATPNAVHARQAHAALSAGKHLVVDKPFTVTVEEAESVVAHAERAGRVLAVFHNRRWDSEFVTVRKLIGDGALGDVRYFESRIDRYRPVVRDRWRERAGAGAGLWYDLGPHLVDQALQLFGQPLGVEGDLVIQRDGAQVDDYFHVVLRYERLRVVLHASMLAAANDLRFVVHGTRGSYVKFGTDPQEEVLRGGGVVGGAEWGVDRQPGVLTSYEGERRVERVVESERGDWRAFYEGVRDAVRGIGGNPVPPSEAVEVMRVVAGVEQGCG
ncbi:MAG: oxidoreductase [Gemmatimonadaceae bacterium]|nr:oxidoreductase [Gemmatimonadaceae bacterium]